MALWICHPDVDAAPMMQDPDEFRQSIAAIRAGSEPALWRLIEQYGPHIRQVVRRRMARELRARFDTLDFVQMVWATFFRDPSRLLQFQSPGDLARYLAAIARHKVMDEYRRHVHTAKYSVHRERPLDSLPTTPLASRSLPDELAMARERWSQLVRGQSERNRQIVQLRIQGLSYVEIAQRLSIHERTARKIIEQLLESYQAEAARDKRGQP